jgi:hypothetical protein
LNQAQERPANWRSKLLLINRGKSSFHQPVYSDNADRHRGGGGGRPDVSRSFAVMKCKAINNRA